MRALFGAAIAIAAGCAACGGETPPVQPDPIDAAGALCDLPPGWTHIASQLRYPAADQGADLDGDGTVDNMIGNIPDAYKQQIHDALDDSMLRGEMEMVIHVTGWSDPPTPDDPDPTIHVLVATDAEVPPVASDNFTGEARFVVHLGEFDLECNLRNGSETASISSGVLTAHRSTWAFALSTGTGTLTFLDATLTTTYSADYRTSSTRVVGTVPACSLRALPFPGEVQGSTLDVIVNDPAMSSAVTIDMDVDGDGLEQVIGDGLAVSHCIDGDGTVIQGRECPCHPSIVDGYSITFDTEAVFAYLVGVIE